MVDYRKLLEWAQCNLKGPYKEEGNGIKEKKGEVTMGGGGGRRKGWGDAVLLA